MSKLKETRGDLIEMALAGEFDLIAHGCNCMCAMGAGIAKTIRKTFPSAYEADLKTPKADRSKLGTCSYASVLTEYGELIVVNAYTQYDWRGSGVKADYEAIRKCMAWAKNHYSGKKIGLPLIGAGLAGGNWEVIQRIIVKELHDEDVTVVRLKS